MGIRDLIFRPLTLSEALADKRGSRFHVWYTISEPPKGDGPWKYGIGRLTEKMMLENLHRPGAQVRSSVESFRISFYRILRT